MSVIEKVELAIREAAHDTYDAMLLNGGNELARAALTALLEGREPVAWRYERTSSADGNKPHSQRSWVEDVMRVQPIENEWQRKPKPLYDLSDVRGELGL